MVKARPNGHCVVSSACSGQQLSFVDMRVLLLQLHTTSRQKNARYTHQTYTHGNSLCNEVKLDELRDIEYGRDDISIIHSPQLCQTLHPHLHPREIFVYRGNVG